VPITRLLIAVSALILLALGLRRLSRIEVPELGLTRADLVARPIRHRPGRFASGRYISAALYMALWTLYALLAALAFVVLVAIDAVLPITPRWLDRKLLELPLHRASHAARLRRRYSSPDAQATLARDRRPPVLLLRSFVDDELLFDDEGISDRTFEEAVTDQLWGFGPVVAIGRPNETLPLSGAVREYVSHDVWQERVEELARYAVAILMIMEPTPGFGWELQDMARLKCLNKVVLVMPPLPFKEVERRWATLVAELGLAGGAAEFAEAARVPGAICAVVVAGPARESAPAVRVWHCHRSRRTHSADGGIGQRYRLFFHFAADRHAHRRYPVHRGFPAR
jgi:hypothetical protein